MSKNASNFVISQHIIKILRVKLYELSDKFNTDKDNLFAAEQALSAARDKVNHTRQELTEVASFLQEHDSAEAPRREGLDSTWYGIAGLDEPEKK